MRARRILQSTALVLVVTAGWAAPAIAATNLVTNPGFNTNRTGWTDPPSSGNITTTAWNRDDARGSATSGSFAVTNSNPAGFIGSSGPSQCVPATGGARYDLGVKIELPGGQTGTGTAYAILNFAPTTNCTFAGSSTFSPPVTIQGGRFTSIALRDVLAPAGTQSVLVTLIVFKDSGSSVTAQFDDVFLGLTGGCVPSQTVLCLDGGRFAVDATFTAPGAAAATAQAIALTDDTGYLWFFSANNVEVTVKVLNACVVNGFHWVFVSGLTNVQVAMTVKDTQVGTTRTYANGQGQTFQTQLDTSAFVCP
jgi:hypothetical protein